MATRTFSVAVTLTRQYTVYVSASTGEAAARKEALRLAKALAQPKPGDKITARIVR